MIRYVYDGSFDGFLCAASRALHGAESCGTARVLPRDVTVSSIEHDDGDLFSREVRVVTDEEAARAFAVELAAVAGRDELEGLLLAHASSDPMAPGLLFRYVAETFAAGAPVKDNIAVAEILAVGKIQDRVSKEINKLLGFLRFRKVAERHYYAPVSPDSNIVGFLGPHFSDRFRDMAFLIHDVKRRIAFQHDLRGASGIVDLADFPEELSACLAAEREPIVQSLWKEYFRRIAIPERRNPALQAKNMPNNYWTHMVEIEDRADGCTVPAAKRKPAFFAGFPAPLDPKVKGK
jgi:probable DNA metabolism protein